MSKFTKEKLLKILRENIPEISFTGEVDRLSGGNINVVWRAKAENKHVIIKHAPPHIATNPDIPLSNSRIDFEARALREFNKGGSFHSIASSEIRPPKLYAYDEEHSLIILEDVGNFQELSFSTLESGSPQKIGERLGRFIGEFHRSTFQDEKFISEFHNLEIQKVRNQLQYQPAHEYAEWEEDKLEAAIKRRSQGLGNRLLERGKCLIMGDLWPPSVFVGGDEKIRLIDWEFVHFGRPLQDVGHFAAHCWMQGHIEGSTQKTKRWKTLWESFLKGYKDQSESLYDEMFGEQELADTGIHIGTEILIRAFGPFKNGYIYEPYGGSENVLREAKERALDFILDAEAIRLEFNL